MRRRYASASRCQSRRGYRIAIHAARPRISPSANGISRSTNPPATQAGKNMAVLHATACRNFTNTGYASRSLLRRTHALHARTRTHEGAMGACVQAARSERAKRGQVPPWLVATCALAPFISIHVGVVPNGNLDPDFQPEMPMPRCCSCSRSWMLLCIPCNLGRPPGATTGSRASGRRVVRSVICRPDRRLYPGTKPLIRVRPCCNSGRLQSNCTLQSAVRRTARIATQIPQQATQLRYRP